MCGRYANHVKVTHEWDSILTDWPEGAAVGFNISPTQSIPAFTKSGGVAMRWGLVPNWSKTLSNKYATFNARIETIDSKPTFRHAWSASLHCLIPALGYYEWRTERDGKQPYFVRSSGSELLLFAGLYEPARENAIPASCTIITRPATKGMVRLHPRMPVILNRAQAEQWLNSPTGKSREIVLSDRLSPLTVYAVSQAVNNAGNQGPQLIERLNSMPDQITDT